MHYYDRDAAVAYAIQYAINYNSNYVSYASGGGDCANFVSNVSMLAAWK